MLLDKEFQKLKLNLLKSEITCLEAYMDTLSRINVSLLSQDLFDTYKAYQKRLSEVYDEISILKGGENK